MNKIFQLNDTINFGSFMGMTVKEAAESRPKELLKEQNGTIFNISKEAMTYLRSKLV